MLDFDAVQRGFVERVPALGDESLSLASLRLGHCLKGSRVSALCLRKKRYIEREQKRERRVAVAVAAASLAILAARASPRAMVSARSLRYAALSDSTCASTACSNRLREGTHLGAL